MVRQQWLNALLGAWLGSLFADSIRAVLQSLERGVDGIETVLVTLVQTGVHLLPSYRVSKIAIVSGHGYGLHLFTRVDLTYSS